MSSLRLARYAFYILLATAPLGTRYIFSVGEIGDWTTEAGTVSLFGTQLLALLIVALLFFSRRLRLQKIDWLPASLIIVSTASALWSNDGRTAVLVSWLVLGYLLVLAVRALQPKLTTVLWSLLVGGALQALLALWQFASQQVAPNKWLGMAAHLSEVPGTFVVETLAGRWLRVYGTLPHPNMLGAYLVLAILSGAALIIALRQRPQLIAAALTALNSFALALTMSRSAALALLVGLAVLVSAVFICGQVNPARWRTVMLAVALVAVSLLSSLALLREQVTTRWTAEGRLEKQSVESRIDQIVDAQLLLSNKRILGVGPGRTPYALAEQTTERPPWSLQYIHNVPLLLLVEIGPLGLLAWLALLTAAFIYIARLLCRSWRPEQLALIAALPALSVITLVDHFVWTSWFGQLILWVIIGLIFALNKEKNHL